MPFTLEVPVNASSVLKDRKRGNTNFTKKILKRPDVISASSNARHNSRKGQPKASPDFLKDGVNWGGEASNELI